MPAGHALQSFSLSLIGLVVKRFLPLLWMDGAAVSAFFSRKTVCCPVHGLSLSVPITPLSGASRAVIPRELSRRRRDATEESASGV